MANDGEINSPSFVESRQVVVPLSCVSPLSSASVCGVNEKIIDDIVFGILQIRKIVHFFTRRPTHWDRWPWHPPAVGLAFF